MKKEKKALTASKPRADLYKRAADKADSMRNCVNELELEAWLGKVAREKLGSAEECSGSPRLAKALAWLKSVGRKYQLREGASAPWSAGLGEGAGEAERAGSPSPRPAWLSTALRHGRELTTLSLLHEEQEALAGIMDWMRGEQGPSMGSDWSKICFKQALQAERDWIENKARAFAQKKSVEDDSAGTELFAELGGADSKEWACWRWVRVLSPSALDREGALMRHCVGSYAKDVGAGKIDIYSLRDPENKPRLTVEAHGEELWQLKAFANAACPRDWLEAVGVFVSRFEEAAREWGRAVKLSREFEEAGFAWLDGVGVFHEKYGLAGGRAKKWIGRLAELGNAVGKGTAREAHEAVIVLAKAGLGHELEQVLALRGFNPELSEVLSLAARDGRETIVELLLSYGADPKAEHSSALRWAAKNGRMAVVEMLLPVSDPKAADSLALRWAAHNGHMAVVELLIPVSDPKADESKALRWAAQFGREEIVELLISVSDPKANDSEALWCAAKNGHRAVVEMLIPVSDQGIGVCDGGDRARRP